MGNQTIRTKYTLYRKPDQGGAELNGTFVMSMTDQASLLPAGTLDGMELEIIYRTIIIILREIIATFKDNCYHNIRKGTREQSFWCLMGKDRTALEGCGLSFFIGTKQS